MPTKKLVPINDDGKPSPYSVRVLTRDPMSEQAQGLSSLGAVLFQGSFENLETVACAMEGCDGVFVNADSYPVSQQKEIYIPCYQDVRTSTLCLSHKTFHLE
ncbi:MAG: hypothetical protein NXY57DRAFT_1013711 [Lentinula lateritia]|nr:MAG: hypothetical protein NXY57DRAFT_1013711 [Lentinula lateritia]